MAKTVAMIPILLGSTRIPDKNLILVDGHPLVSYVTRACIESGAFDQIYLNSEHAIFGRLAKMLGVEFYPRDPRRGGSTCEMSNKSRQCTGDRCQTHDHYLFDFMDHLKGDANIVQVHTTSPLLEPTTIARFAEALGKQGVDSLFSVTDHYTETLFGDEPMNFSASRKIPTQTLPPVRMISWALSGWKSGSFMECYRTDDAESNGPTFCGNVEYFPLGKLEALDADTWEDLQIIEGCLSHRRHKVDTGRFRFSERVLDIEYDLQELIAHDGVHRVGIDGSNVRITNIDRIKQEMGEPPWLHLLVYSDTDQTALICQLPGEGARKHCHVTHDEWWVVLEGSFEWRLDDGEVVEGKQNDVIFLPKGTIHSIVCTSETAGLRLACGGRDMEHVYYD